MGKMNRFGLKFVDFGIVLVVLVAVGARVYWKAHHSAETTLHRPLKVGIVSWPGFAGGVVANEGYMANKACIFWKYEVVVDFVSLDNDTDRAGWLKRGGGDKRGVDVIWSTVDLLAKEWQDFKNAGIDARAFLQVDWSRGGDAIVATRNVKTIDDLPGKNISLAFASSEWLLNYNLNQHSSLGDKERSEIKPQVKNSSKAALDDFLHNGFDVAGLWEPDVTEALSKREGEGARPLMDTGTAGLLIADVMVADSRFIKKYQNDIRGFISGWMEGAKEANDRPEKAARLLKSNTSFSFADLEEPVIIKMLQKVRLATLSDNDDMFALEPGNPMFDQIFSVANAYWTKKPGATTEPAKPDQVKDVALLKAIYEKAPKTRVPSCDKLDMERGENLAKQVLIPFDKGSVKLSPRAVAVVEQEVDLLARTHSEALFCIVGSPDVGAGVQQGKDRADAVAAFLREHQRHAPERFVGVGRAADKKATAMRLVIIPAPRVR
jgi:NitT/TauT family transport system substrate-binding protein